MEEKTKKVLKGIGIVASGLALAGAGTGIGFVLDQPATIELPGESIVINATPSQLEQAFENGVNSVEPVVETVTETIINESIVEVEVDNGKLDLVLDHIYDNEGSIEYITEDLDDDEVYLIADRIVFVNEIKVLAVDYVKNNLFDELDNEEVTLLDGSIEELDDKDMERLRIDDEQDEIIVEDIDFDDKDSDLRITFRFEQDDVEFSGSALIEIKDGEVDDISEIEVFERD